MRVDRPWAQVPFGVCLDLCRRAAWLHIGKGMRRWSFGMVDTGATLGER